MYKGLATFFFSWGFALLHFAQIIIIIKIIIEVSLFDKTTIYIYISMCVFMYNLILWFFYTVLNDFLCMFLQSNLYCE